MAVIVSRICNDYRNYKQLEKEKPLGTRTFSEILKYKHRIEHKDNGLPVPEIPSRLKIVLGNEEEIKKRQIEMEEFIDGFMELNPLAGGLLCSDGINILDNIFKARLLEHLEPYKKEKTNNEITVTAKEESLPAFDSNQYMLKLENHLKDYALKINEIYRAQPYTEKANKINLEGKSEGDTALLLLAFTSLNKGLAKDMEPEVQIGALFHLKKMVENAGAQIFKAKQTGIIDDEVRSGFGKLKLIKDALSIPSIGINSSNAHIQLTSKLLGAIIEKISNKGINLCLEIQRAKNLKN